MEIGNLFSDLTDILTYIVPGFIFIMIFGVITGQKIFEFDGLHILIYIAISYVLNIIVRTLSLHYELVTVLFLAALSGIIIGCIYKQKLKSEGGRLVKSYPIDDLMRLKESSSEVFIYATLKNNTIRYSGKILLFTDSYNPDYILYDYKIETLDENEQSITEQNFFGKNMYIFLKGDEIDKIEFKFVDETIAENSDE